MNYGFTEPKKDKRDLKLGALSQEVLKEDADWTNYVPIFEAQKRDFETCNCTAFATLNALEAIILKKYGITVNYSDRALGSLAGTKPPGNDPKTVAHTARKFGVVDEELWAFSNDIKNVNEYYKELPRDLKKKCGKWLDVYELSYEWVFEPNDGIDFKRGAMNYALKFSPLGISVNAWNKQGNKYVKLGRDNHWTLLVAENKVYDSYIADGEPFKLLAEDYDSAYCMRYQVVKRTTYKPRDKGLWYMIINFIKNLWKKQTQRKLFPKRKRL